MKKAIHLFFLFSILFSISASGQKGSQFKNEIGISCFTLEDNGLSINPALESKYLFGPYYNRSFSNLSWISHLEYGKNEVKEEVGHLSDGFYGTGNMTELNISSGFRNTFFRHKAFFIKPFIESDLFYSNISYKADLEGGMWGQGLTVDDTYDLYGAQLRVGVLISPISRISLTVSPSAKIGIGTRTDHVENKKENINTGYLSYLQIRLGYHFGK